MVSENSDFGNREQTLHNVSFSSDKFAIIMELCWFRIYDISFELAVN